MEKKEKETVHVKMSDILKRLNPGCAILIPNEVHSYLSKNYDFKQWIVIVIPPGLLKSFYHFRRHPRQANVAQTVLGAGVDVVRTELPTNLRGDFNRSELPYHYATLDGMDPQNSCSSTCILAISFPLYFKEPPVEHSLMPKLYKEMLIRMLKYEAPGNVALSWTSNTLLSSARAAVGVPSFTSATTCGFGAPGPSEEQVADQLIYDLTVSEPRNVYLAVK